MNRKVSLLIIFLATIGLFHKVFYTQFAYSDSYDFLINADHPFFLNRWIQSGRPLFGLLAQWVFTTFSLEGLIWVRCFSLIGSLLFLLRLYVMVSRYLKGPIGLLVILLIAFSPSIGIITVWASTFQISWSLFLALEAGVLAQKLIHDRFSFLSILLMFLFSFISLSLYQPGFAAFILPLFLIFLTQPLPIRKGLYILLLHLALYAVYFVAVKYMLHYFNYSIEGRGELQWNVLYSFAWLVKGPFARSVWMSFIFVPRWIWHVLGALIVLCLGYSVFIKAGKNLTLIIKYILFFIIAYCLSVLPNFLVVDNFTSYRILTVMISLNAIVIGFALQRLVKEDKWRLILATALIIISFGGGYYNINNGLIDVQAREFEMADSYFKYLDKGIDTLHVNIPGPQFLVSSNYLSRTVTDEYGKLSNAIPWVPKPFFELLCNRHRVEPVVSFGTNEAELDKGSLFFDFEDQWFFYKPE